MNKRALIVLIIFVVILLFGGYRFVSSKTSRTAGLKVSSTPVVSVFLDDKLVGKTPYEDKHTGGEYVLKLIPEDTSQDVSSWQGQVNLVPSLLTYVNRDLGSSELTSAGEILSLEKISGSEAQVAVFSTPDGATVLFDGQEKEKTPLLLRDISPGEHDLAISSPGFVSRTIRIQTTLGYKLTVEFQLALASAGEEPTEEEGKEGNQETSETSVDGSFVTIKDTPTGFLRVRSRPTTASTESARVEPGDRYEYIDEQNGWYKIIYEEDKEGWISGTYADIEE